MCALAVAQARSAIIPQLFHVHKKSRPRGFTRLSEDTAGQAQVARQVMNPVAAPYEIPLRQLKGEWMPPFRLRVNQLWARGA